MNLLVEVSLVIVSIFATTIICLLCIVCFVLKSQPGQQFELTEASLPAPDPPPDYTADEKENIF